MDNIHTVVLYHIPHLNWLFQPPYLIFLTYGSCKKGEIHSSGQGMWSCMTPTPCLPPPQELRMDHMNLLGSKFTIFSTPNSCNISNDTHFTTDMCTCRMLSVTHQAARTYTPRTVCLSLLFCPSSGLSKDLLIQFPWEDLYQRDTHMHRMLT
jgi:hypothetical protein